MRHWGWARLGVLGGIEVLRTLNERGISTRRPIEVGIFTEEEGVRFGTDMLGSAVAAGRLTLEYAHALTDRDGHTLGGELARTGFDGPADVRLAPPHAYVECHIEQGPVLAEHDVPVGVVTGVQGISCRRSPSTAAPRMPAPPPPTCGPTPVSPPRRSSSICGPWSTHARTATCAPPSAI
ncbi:M20/M25/M40 family metallo-hydrolase [Streptomyces sp. NPDC001406]|uniref:M20/M25/M40 family metallo-hydrolase n=1 Tax=Streptomyces sp. NPDC001406 TaxID=3364572 RepID=UPI0036CA3B55